MKVLIANDRSATSEEAARVVTRLPFPGPIELMILHAISLPDMPTKARNHEMWPQMIASLEESADEDNEKLAKSLKNVPKTVESIVVRGEPAEEILKAAEANETDLVAMGAVGRTAFTRMALGSVSDRVATHAECSTLVVRPSGATADATKAAKILVAYDGSVPSKRALDEIASFDWPEDSEIVLLRAFHTAEPYYYGFAPELTAIRVDEVAEFEKQLEVIADELRSTGLRVSTEAREAAHVGDEICRRAKELESNIVVVGSHGYRGMKKFLLGSVSQYVLRHAPCSVWIAR